MNPAVWGVLSALSLGASDFASRFSSRALGVGAAFFVVLLVGSALLSVWVAVTQPPLVWLPAHLWLLALSGVSTALMTALLYTGLARGPVSVVAPIVAAHPVLVLAVWVMLGTRPSTIQWLAMTATIFGVVIVARSRVVDATTRGSFRVTVIIACAACAVYAVTVVSGQAAVPIYGELQTLWVSRLVGLACLICFFVVRMETPTVPLRWWPFLIAQGCLDAGGYLFLYAGSHVGDGRVVVAVTASAFGAVTALLGRFVLKEHISPAQWFGLTLIFSGVGVLSVS